MADLDHDAIRVLSDQICKAILSGSRMLNHDVTVQGRITAILGQRKYKVQIAGIEYVAKAMQGATYATNQVVYALICKNDYKHIIILSEV